MKPKRLISIAACAVIMSGSLPSLVFAQTNAEYEKLWSAAFESTADVREYFDSEAKMDVPPIIPDVEIGLLYFMSAVYRSAIDNSGIKALLEQASPTDPEKTKSEVVGAWMDICIKEQKSLSDWDAALKKVKEYTDFSMESDIAYDFQSDFAPGGTVHTAVKTQYSYIIGRGPTENGYVIGQPCLIAVANVIIGAGIQDEGALIPYPAGPITSDLAKTSGSCFFVVPECQPAIKLKWTRLPDQDTANYFARITAAAKDLNKIYSDKLKVAQEEAPIPPDTGDVLNKGSVIGASLPMSDIAIPDIVKRVINQILGIVGALGLAMFIYGGFLYMTAAGSTDRAANGQKAIVWSTLGLVIIFAAYAIINFLVTALTTSI